MRSEIKLVILTPGFATDESETTAFPSLQLYLENLKVSYPGIRIMIITFHYPFKHGQYSWKEIPVYATGGNRRKAGKLRTWYRVLKYLFSLKRTSGIDVIHAFWLTDTALIGSLFRLLTGTPLVLTAMGQDVKKENRYLRILPLNRVKLTFLSKFQSEYNPRLFDKGKLKVIPLGIDPEYYTQDPAERTTDILGVGSLNKIKNYPGFLQIIHAVSMVIPGLRCRILGKGDEYRHIRELITGLHLEDIITLAGEVPYKNAIREMHSATILLHTSVFEGQGLIITEALASGAYVVCYPTGIAQDLKCKKLFTGSTKSELIDHVITILQDPEPDYSKHVIYTINDTCKEFMEIYTNLVAD